MDGLVSLFFVLRIFLIIMKKNLVFQIPGGEKIPLNAEVGKYFSADGLFDEIVYSSVIKEYLGFFKKNLTDNDSFLEQSGKWLSSYLTSVVDYLKRKNMLEAAYNLFKVTVEECVNSGINKFSVSTGLLKSFFVKLASIPVNEQEADKKLSKDKKRKNIFNAAIQVFGEEGYHKATVDKIAALSGVGKGSVYRYFNSKEELFEQLLSEEYQKIVKRINLIFSKERSVLDQVQEMIEFWVGFIDDNPLIYRLIQSEDITEIGDKRVMFYEYISSHLPMLKERIIALNKDKKIKTTSFYTVFYGIFGFIDGVVHKWMRSGMKYSLRKEIPVIMELVFNGFVGEKGSNKRFYVPQDEKRN